MGLGPDRGERRARYVAKARAELGDLAARGVVMAGNAFSSVVLVKGLPGEGERGAQGLLTKQDGSALRAALQALGYAPEDWAGLAAWDDTGELLSVELFREALCALDPATVILCDEPAAQLAREAFAADLFLLEHLDEAMLADGVVAQVAGMRMMALGSFAAALSDKREKQVMWRRLKQLPPLGEPY